MKKLFTTVTLVALLATASLTSCFSDDDNNLIMYGTYVTITGNATAGYMFYADEGFTLIPTTTSVETALPALATSNVERAYIVFQLVDQEEGFVELLSGHIYNINVIASSNNTSIPTDNIVDFYQNEKADTLVTRQDKISDIGSQSWVANGYITMGVSITYDPSAPCSINMAYNSQVDIDRSKNKVTFTLYYDNNTDNPYQSGSALFSFRIPPFVYETLQGEEVVLEIKALMRGATQAEVVQTIRCMRSNLRRDF